MVRVALYTRVSTEDQAKEGFSLDAQLERLRYFAKAQNWEVAGEFVDEGHSGRTTKRPKYQEMMACREKWDTLLVMKMDRIHRNSRNFMAMMDDLRREGKEFASVMENLDTGSAMGRFVMDIIQRIAQLESEQIGERVAVGMEQKAKVRGGSLGKPAPFGYEYGPESRLRPVPLERTWVERIYSECERGTRRDAIADLLTQQGVPTRKGGAWTRHTVTNILTNPTYAGALQWDEQLQLDMHEAIVAPVRWDALQDRLGRAGSRYRLTRLELRA